FGVVVGRSGPLRVSARFRYEMRGFGVDCVEYPRPDVVLEVLRLNLVEVTNRLHQSHHRRRLHVGSHVIRNVPTRHSRLLANLANQRRPHRLGSAHSNASQRRFFELLDIRFHFAPHHCSCCYGVGGGGVTIPDSPQRIVLHEANTKGEVSLKHVSRFSDPRPLLLRPTSSKVKPPQAGATSSRNRVALKGQHTVVRTRRQAARFQGKFAVLGWLIRSRSQGAATVHLFQIWLSQFERRLLTYAP